MVMYIKVNLLMDFLKAMGNIFGMMVVNTREILSKVTEMDTEFGLTKRKFKNIKVIICLIKSMGLEFIISQMTMFIKEIM